MKKPILLVLILLNAVVLLGQLWPAGAPPFARAVNIGFLILSFGYFIAEWSSGRRGKNPG
jgi:hypothetical protein